jgi:hypothetical protein
VLYWLNLDEVIGLVFFFKLKYYPLHVLHCDIISLQYVMREVGKFYYLLGGSHPVVYAK